MFVGSTLGHMQCDLAAMFGFLTFCLNFIPTVGLLVAVLLPLPVVVLAPTCDNDVIQELKDASPRWTGQENATIDMTAAGAWYVPVYDAAALHTSRARGLCVRRLAPVLTLRKAPLKSDAACVRML